MTPSEADSDASASPEHPEMEARLAALRAEVTAAREDLRGFLARTAARLQELRGERDNLRHLFDESEERARKDAAAAKHIIEVTAAKDRKLQGLGDLRPKLTVLQRQYESAKQQNVVMKGLLLEALDYFEEQMGEKARLLSQLQGYATEVRSTVGSLLDAAACTFDGPKAPKREP